MYKRQVAIPSYSRYVVKTKVSSGVMTIDQAKDAVVDAFLSGGIAAVNSLSNDWAASWEGQNYLDDVSIEPGTGIITVTFDDSAIPAIAGANQMTVAPWVSGGELTDGAQGAIEWACVSSGNRNASAEGYGATEAPANPIDIAYAPYGCD